VLAITHDLFTAYTSNIIGVLLGVVATILAVSVLASVLIPPPVPETADVPSSDSAVLEEEHPGG